MSRADRQALARILNEARRLPNQKRAEFLDRACGSERDLRAEVESLLAADDESSLLLDETGATAPPTPQESSALAMVGRRIGAYSIMEVIASGGMGTVFLAKQKNPPRSVALKILHSGVTSPSTTRQPESYAVALEHPNIAKIYEAGTIQGDSGDASYVAMEFIPGAMPITNWAEQQKLGTRERLELFTRVCDGVNHAHQHGIVHLDIKPANILVDSRGTAKVIDFGIARITHAVLEDTTFQTDVGQLVGTLQYMSPEQCWGGRDDIDTRSDVYSLGMVLYELLFGTPPYEVRHSNLVEAARTIREVEPTRPRTIDPRLPRDIETIVLKCLEKEPARRYQSASDLSEDIRRFLNLEPIRAQGPSPLYKASRLARRNRWQVAASGCAAIAVVTVCVAYPLPGLLAVLGTLSLVVGLIAGSPDAWAAFDRSVLPGLRPVALTLVGAALIIGSAAVPNLSAGGASERVTSHSESPLEATIADLSRNTRQNVSAVLECVIDHPRKGLANEAFRLSASLSLRAEGRNPIENRLAGMIIDRIHASNAISMRLNLAGADVEPSGANTAMSDGTYWWSIAPSNPGRQEGFLTIAIDGTLLNSDESTDPLILLRMDPDLDLAFTMDVADRASNWVRLVMIMLGGPLILAQTVGWGYKAFRVVERRRAADRRRKPVIVLPD